MKAYAVVGLQYGSEGKGNVVAKLATEREPDVVVHNWGPNSGHTAVLSDGRKLIHTMLHLSIISPKLEYILFGPGSIINIASLEKEIHAARDILDINRPTFIFHPHCAVVTDGHRELEKERVSIGSTMKGTGEAAIERMRRKTDGTANVMVNTPSSALSISIGYPWIVSAEVYNQALKGAKVVAIEGCQGFSLSMYHGFYPYTTSRDTSVNQLLADCGIPRKTDVEVIGCVRTFPIRVANRKDEKGDEIGWSGPCYDDQKETTFEAIGQKVEYTTVTKLPRRVFTFSHEQVQAACRMNGVDKIALMFCDYLQPEEVTNLAAGIESLTGVDVKWLSYGPSAKDILPTYKVTEEDDGEID